MLSLAQSVFCMSFALLESDTTCGTGGAAGSFRLQIGWYCHSTAPFSSGSGPSLSHGTPPHLPSQVAAS